MNNNLCHIATVVLHMCLMVVLWYKPPNSVYLYVFLIKYGILLAPWCRILLEKLNVLQLVKKLPTFYGTLRFITALTSVCHLSNKVWYGV
jgi:hypothetical protein